MIKVIFLADAWGPKYGGINSFNYDLCLNLPSVLDCERCAVICVTSSETLSSDEQRKVRDRNLKIYNLSKKDFNCDGIINILENQKEDTVWWIGHDIITGNLAIECAKRTNSQCAVIHHMDYDAYYNLVNSDQNKTSEKINFQKNIFKKADKVFAVGPKLAKSAKDILHSNGRKIEVYQLIPGLAEIEPIEEINSKFKAITFGRLSTSEKDIIKQSLLAVQSFAKAAFVLNFPIDDNITLIGYSSLENNDEVKSYLNKAAIKYAKRTVNIKVFEYTEERNQLFDTLRNSSVCLMLSLHEGFGLAGWEAISAGVPLILSINSGLFEFLSENKMSLKVCAIDVKGSMTDDANNYDLTSVSNMLINIKNNFETYKTTAIELREELLAKGYTWENTALSFIRGLGIESKDQVKQRNILEKIKKNIIVDGEMAQLINEDWEKIAYEFEISQKYNRIRDAYKDIARDLQKSTFLKVHGMRGSTFCPDADNSITDVLNNKTISVEILTMYPFSEYINKRLITLSNYRKSENELKRHHRDLYNTAKSFTLSSNYVTKFFVFPLLFRLIFTETHLYMSLYEDGVHARDSKVFKFRSNTKTYRMFLLYFKKMWDQSTNKLPTKAEEVSSEYRFIFDKSFVKPSLVINICSLCNMGCKYCPTGGENLIQISEKEYISTKQISKLIKLFPSCGGNSVLRITGGEPLLDRDTRLRTADVLKAAYNNKYDKIVLCTNAIHLETAYNENPKLWELIKEKLLLKISFDTLNEESFSSITRCNSNLLEEIKNNISFAKSKMFKIELNMVVTKDNVNDVIPIYEFAQKNQLVGLKVLTVNDFGGRILIEKSEQSEVEKKLICIINNLKRQGIDDHDVPLNDGVGIRMKRFILTTDLNQKCTLTFVDHNTQQNSITTKRLYCEFCKECKFYPCATGIMNLTLRADGMLSQCRLKEDQMVDIKNVHPKKMKGIIDRLLTPFSNCFWLDIGGGYNEEI